MSYYFIARGLNIVFIAVSAILTGLFGSTFGGESWMLSFVWFCGFACISILSWFLWEQMGMHTHLGNTKLVTTIVPFACFFLVVDIGTNFGAGALYRKSEMVASKNQNIKAKDMRGEVKRLEKDIAAIRADVAWTGNYRAPGAYDELIANGEKYVAMEAARGGCARKCEARMRELDSLRAEKANALRREALKEEMVVLGQELAAAKAASADNPTRASAAITHAMTLGSLFSGQMEPDDRVQFWSNYMLTFIAALGTALASIITGIILGWMKGGPEVPTPAAVARNPYIADHRTAEERAKDPAPVSITTINASQEDRSQDALRRLHKLIAEVNEAHAI